MLTSNAVEMYRKFFDHYTDALNSSLTEPERKAFILAIAFNLEDEYGERIAHVLLPKVTDDDVSRFTALARMGKKEPWSKIAPHMFEIERDGRGADRAKMLREWSDYVNRHGVCGITGLEMWRKALELSDKYGLEFCWDFLPYPTAEICEGLGKSLDELADMTIDYNLWQIGAIHDEVATLRLTIKCGGSEK